MFIVTSLPMRTGVGRYEFTFTFSKTHCLCECDDGSKKLSLIPHSISVQIDKTEPREVELISLFGTPTSGDIWFRFPMGTFNRIIENVHNFKGEDLLNLLN
jgi:hypothetical protein